MVDCASACITRAMAIAISRLPVCACSTRLVSCGSPKPCHQDGSAQIFAWSGAAVVKDLGCICGARACGTGVEQPASSNGRMIARPVTAFRVSARMAGVSLTGLFLSAAWALFITQRMARIGARHPQRMGKDGGPGHGQCGRACPDELER